MMPASDPSGKLWDNFAAQMKQVMDNLTAVLKSAGTDWSRVIKTNVMLVRPNDFAQMNRIYGSYFAEGNTLAERRSLCANCRRSPFWRSSVRRRWNNFVFRACACIIPGYA